MKQLLCLFTLVPPLLSFSQPVFPVFQMKLQPESVFQKPEYKMKTDSAIVLVNTVFNSPEFRKWVQDANYQYSSYCRKRTSCKYNMKDQPMRIPADSVLADLYRTSIVAMRVDVDSVGDCLGRTCPNHFFITTYYENVMDDMDTDAMPPSYKLAVNICHEYMHQVGYCHIYNRIDERNGQPDSRYYKNDVTYSVGWYAYFILRQWYYEHRSIPGL